MLFSEAFAVRRVEPKARGWRGRFLALDGNPLEDFEAIMRIGMRVKQGVVAEPMTTGGPER